MSRIPSGLLTLGAVQSATDDLVAALAQFSAELPGNHVPFVRDCRTPDDAHSHGPGLDVPDKKYTSLGTSPGIAESEDGEGPPVNVR